MFQIFVQRLRPGEHVRHRVVPPVALGLDPIHARPTTLFVVVRQILGHVQQAFEVVGVVGAVFDDQLPLGVGHRGRMRFFLAFGRLGDLVLVRLDLVEARIVFHLLLDAFLQGHQRQLQNFHRLDHPRCKHLLLSQLHLLTERESHDDCLTMTIA